LSGRGKRIGGGQPTGPRPAQQLSSPLTPSAHAAVRTPVCRDQATSYRRLWLSSRQVFGAPRPGAAVLAPVPVESCIPPLVPPCTIAGKQAAADQHGQCAVPRSKRGARSRPPKLQRESARGVAALADHEPLRRGLVCWPISDVCDRCGLGRGRSDDRALDSVALVVRADAGDDHLARFPLRDARATRSRAGPWGGCAPPRHTACNRRVRSSPLTAIRTSRPVASSSRTAWAPRAAGPAPAATADRTAAVVSGHDPENPFVHFVESPGVDFEEFKRGDRYGATPPTTPG
jgi:hypothetical protein